MATITRRPLVGRLALVLLSLTGALAMVEVALRLADWRFSPLAFQRRNDPDGWRADGMPSLASLKGRAAIAFDADLFWRVDHRGASAGDAERDDRLLVALGDGATFGSLDAPDHWPGVVQYLADLNEAPRRLRVVNAAVPGYSSLQGLRRFRDLLRHRPDVAFFAFGANDAHAVRLPDAEYAARIEALRPWGWSRLAPSAFHLAWAFAARGRPASPRVPPEDFARQAEAFVTLSRERRVVPVLVTRPGRAATLAPYNAITKRVAAETRVACLDMAGAVGDDALYLAGDLGLSRAGRRRAGEIVLRHLVGAGFVSTSFLRAAEVDLGGAGDERPEIGAGWWPAETWADGTRGRWTGREASLTLERREREEGLVVDATLQSPQDHTTGRVEVNGRTVGEIAQGNGRCWQRLDVSGVADHRLEVRIVVDTSFVPRETDPPNPDDRRLGAFVHAVRLVRSGEPLEWRGESGLYAAGLELGQAEDARPELGVGWWPRETWSDGRGGRWTSREASLYLERRGDEGGLLVDLTLQSPENATACRVEANGQTVYAFRNHNGRYHYGIDIRRVPGREIAVRFVVERPFRPKTPVGDVRSLGLFVHTVRLARSPIP